MCTDVLVIVLMEVVSMAVRTISRDSACARSILVWPKGVNIDAVSTNDNGAHYAVVNGETVQPVAFSADQFKAAFGFVPLTDSVAGYELYKL